jgi:RHS repeat-associated protein
LAVLEQVAGGSDGGGVEILQDDGDPGTSQTGSWLAKNSNKAHEGDYRLAEGGVSKYRWTPAIDAGTYDVHVWYVRHKSHSEAAYHIGHAGQVSTAVVDQSSGGGSWHLIGSGLEFDGTGNEYVEVSAAGGKTVADAVRFVNVNGGTDSGTVTKAYYVHNDQLGAPLAMTDDQADVVWHASYDPYGKASLTVNTVELNVRFPGQYFDQETGLHYNYFRYYDTETGRYLTSDPIGLGGGLNTYVYVEANPVNWVDPYGLRVKPHSNGVNRSGTFVHGFDDYFADFYGEMNPYPEASCEHRWREWAIDLMALGVTTGISDIAGALSSGDEAVHRDMNSLADILTNKAAENYEYIAGRYAANALNMLLFSRITGLYVLPGVAKLGLMGGLSLGSMGYSSYMRGVKILESHAEKLFPCECEN